MKYEVTIKLTFDIKDRLFNLDSEELEEAKEYFDNNLIEDITKPLPNHVVAKLIGSSFIRKD